MRRGATAFVLVCVLAGGSACARTVRLTNESPSAAATAAPAATPVPATAPASAAPATLAPGGPILPDHGTFDARPADRIVSVWKAPSAGDPSRLQTTNPLGQRLEMLVTGARRDANGVGWLRVLLPDRPNGSQGWVRADDVRLIPTDQRIVVDLSSRTLIRLEDGKVLDTFHVGIGTPQTPTATGTFYVWAQVPESNPAGPYGVFALGLSGFSQVLRDWPGGGRMAIHGTSDPADRGGAVSHGCVRVYNPDMLALRDVPLGTPVVIRP